MFESCWAHQLSPSNLQRTCNGRAFGTAKGRPSWRPFPFVSTGRKSLEAAGRRGPIRKRRVARPGCRSPRRRIVAGAGPGPRLVGDEPQAEPRSRGFKILRRASVVWVRFPPPALID